VFLNVYSFDYPVGIIFSTFQGELRMENQQVLVKPEEGDKPRFDLDRGTST